MVDLYDLVIEGDVGMATLDSNGVLIFSCHSYVLKVRKMI